MLDGTTTYGPFGRAAHTYREAGWLGTLPIGRAPGQKSPPPEGWTGHGVPYPSNADIGAWLETHADRNIGLRAPAGVIGLDVDQYGTKTGAETLAALEARFGSLPPTWVSSARPAPSGIRWFRVPLELDGREINWPGEAGKFIEIIQPGHRYAVVWPSTNPEAAGAEYGWRHELGLALPRSGEMPPQPSELSALPEAWVRGLALSYDRADKAALDDAQAAGWFAQLRMDGRPCPVIHSVLTKAVDDLREVAGARHETARDALAALVRYGGEGHTGTRAAVSSLGAAFEQAVGSQRIADGEWRRLLTGAVRLAAADNKVPRQHCEHDPATELPAALLPPVPDFPAPGAAEHEAASGWVDQVVEDVDKLPRDERDDAVRAAALAGAGLPEIELARARAALTTRGGMSGVTLGEFDSIVKDARKQAKEQAKALAEQAARQRAADAVAAKREEGLLLPPPHAPIDVARELAPQLPAASKWWRGDYYLWDGTRYALWRDEAVDNWLYQRTADAYFEGAEDKGPAPWRPTENKINGVSHALSRGVLYHPSETEPDDSPSQVACANGVFDVVTGALLPHDPVRFNLASVPFDYDPAAKAPTWEWFLNDVLPADAQVFLRQWFGYVLSGRTDLEKIANLVGKRRSGKGTIATVLEALVGAENVAAPSMPSLVGSFGEQPLIGKTLAVFSDISWSFRDIAEAVEIVKKISGNDSRDVNRKNREIWHGRLGVRFMIMGNDMPRFTDASGALAGRMIHVQFPGSFYGRELPGVKAALLNELPGILNWALAGLAELTERGSFTMPQTSEDLAAEVRRQQSPVQGFLDDLCTFPENANPVPLDELHPVYRKWALAGGVEHALDRERFSRALASAGFIVERKMIDGLRARRVHGIAPATVTAWTELINPIGTFPQIP